MSKRMYVQTKHEIEYGNSHFNYQQAEVYSLLRQLDCYVYDGDDCGYGDEVEVKRADVERACDILRSFMADENYECDNCDRDDVRDALDELYKDGYAGYSFNAKAEMFLKVLESWLKESPERYEWIWLSWF